MIRLGDEVKDTQTGFQGKVVAHTAHLYSGERITVQCTKLKKNGQIIEPVSFDAEQLDVVKPGGRPPVIPEQDSHGKRVRLGDKVKDADTKFIGLAIARTTWLYGCERILVQSEKLVEGVPPEPAWFDAAQLIVVKSSAPEEPENLADKKPNGPHPEPVRAKDPV